MRQLPIVFATAALLTASCASHQPMSEEHGMAATRAGACKAKDTPDECYILVDATYNAATNRCTVDVVPSQQDVGILKGVKDKWIRWKLTESAADEGFRFAAVDPKSTPPGSAANVTAWRLNFSNGGADHGGKQFKWKNGNAASQEGTEYQYLVTVRLPRPGSAPDVICTRDPVIRNQR
jgi:hypothetical protein